VKILITGATGFIGPHIMRAFHQGGHEVYGLARSVEKFENLKLPGACLHGSLSSAVPNQWIDELPESIDLVIHAAGLIHSFNSADFYQTNSYATKQLIHDLKNKYPRLKFILVSSLAAVGPSLNAENMITESQAPRPVGHYGKSKLLAESYLQEFAPKGWETTIVRPPIIFGPGDPAFLDLFKMIKNKRIIEVGKKGLHKNFSFICVHDLVDNIVQLSLKDKMDSSQTYFLSHCSVVEFQEIISTIQKLLEVDKLKTFTIPHTPLYALSFLFKTINYVFPLNIRLTPEKITELKYNHWVCSNHKSKKELQSVYKWNLQQTLKVTYEDYIKNNWL
jgi:nucleoside-diphosphate-sugar epimerase